MAGIKSEVPDGSEYVQGTLEKARGIKAIDKGTVHRICSGQVVLTLATAVKELTENSIDAGATTVEVRLKEHGVTSIEVIDNGKGVEEHDFEGLTLKHHTSKIKDFGDLVGVKTFGFRGEALSSLCALSVLTITTRHSSQSVGTKLVYDHNGKLSSKIPTSRQVGTTVTLQNLFSTLPVRHKEFQRNIKKEFNKMVQILYSYCLISTKVKLTCTNQTDKGKKTVVVATNGHPTIKENISAVFGAKQSSSMLEFQQMTATEETLQEYGIKLDPKIIKGNELFTLEGHISSCAHGLGRSSADRQFYFINQRPCDPARVSKIVNEVYHSYNRHQFPAVVLNIKLKEDDVDINVTPDKRQILVNNEKLLLATIKTSLLCLYENIPSTFNMSNTSLNRSLSSSMNGSFSSSSCLTASPESFGTQKNGTPSGPRVSALTERFGRRSISGSQDSPTAASPVTSSPIMFGGLKRSLSHAAGEPHSKQPKLENFIKTSGSDNESNIMSENTTPQTLDESKNNYDCTKLENRTDNDADCESICDEKPLSFDNIGLSTHETNQQVGEQINDTFYSQKDFEDASEIFENDNIVLGRLNNFEQIQSSSNDNKSGLNSISKFNINPTLFAPSPSSNYKSAHNATDNFLNNLKAKRRSVPGATNENTSHNVTTKAHNATDKFLNSLKARRNSPEITIENTPISQYCPSRSICKTSDENLSTLETVKVEYMNTSEINDLEIEEFDGYEEIERNEEYMLTAPKMIICEEYDPQVLKATRKSKSVYFSISNIKEKLEKQKRRKDVELVRRFRAKIAPTDNSAAEEELRKEISKDMFVKMEVLGQFNLGFIICCLGSDLFIVDQHATDEKYNFETLQATYQLQNQRLIVPQNLELTCVNEAILLDNIHIFNKNGFEFKVDESAQTGRRVSLTSMPISKGWEFGREDIEELIFMLSDAPGVICRPSRVRAMFASRSCRKSVMIGTALSVSQMRGLVRHMGEIEQPWNCPHGRPTMRHLINLDMVTDIKGFS